MIDGLGKSPVAVLIHVLAVYFAGNRVVGGCQERDPIAARQSCISVRKLSGFLNRPCFEFRIIAFLPDSFTQCNRGNQENRTVRSNPANLVDQFLDAGTDFVNSCMIILLAVIPPVVEEFIFRGLIYHSYRKNGICGAALLSGLLFGVTHLNINQLCYAFVIGVMFAFLVEVTGSMWSSMIAHFAVNTYSITVMKILSLAGVDVNAMAGQTQQLSSGSMFIATIIQVIVLGAIAMGFLALSILILKKLAERNGKAGFIRRDFELRHVRRNGEKFVTIPLIITLVLAFGYMIFTEIITRLTMMV